MNVDLLAGDFRVWIGMPFNESELSSAQFSKVGFFMGLTMPKIKQPGDTIYRAKNPRLVCFDGATSVVPNVGGGVSSADLICGTSVFLYFNSGYLRLALAQVMMSFIWAQTFTDEFRQAAVKSFGDAECTDLVSVPTFKGSSIQNQIHLKCAWRDGKEFLISQLVPRGDNAYVFWGRDK